VTTDGKTVVFSADSDFMPDMSPFLLIHSPAHFHKPFQETHLSVLATVTAPPMIRSERPLRVALSVRIRG
jgi:hypothetical protein